jgi:hypothetical protein
MEKKISVNGVQVRIWKEAFSANLQTNKLYLKRQNYADLRAKFKPYTSCLKSRQLATKVACTCAQGHAK